jgi:hypothetical protein
MHILPGGALWKDNHPAAFLPNPLALNRALSFANSALAAYISWILDPLLHTRTSGLVATIPFAPAILDSEELGRNAQEIYDLRKEWSTGNEVSTLFIEPWILQVVHGFDSDEKPITQHLLAMQFKWSGWPSAYNIRSVKGSLEMSLESLAKLCQKRQQILNERVDEVQKRIDEEVYRIYGLSTEDVASIKRELARQKDVDLGGEGGSEEEKEEPDAEESNKTKKGNKAITIDEHVKRLISYYVKKVIEADEDGVTPLDEMYPDNLVSKIRRFVQEDFGNKKLDIVELEISEILGKPLKTWLLEDYFDFHVSLYRRRPIFWHLTSLNFSPARGSKGVMNIFINYRKLDRDIVPKILTNYVKPELETTKWKTERLKRELQEARDQGNRTKERELSKQFEESLTILEEMQNFQKVLETIHNPRPDRTRLPKNPTWLQQKIAEVRDDGYNPVIDYGVRVNIEPLKEAGLLHKAAQRVR